MPHFTIFRSLFAPPRHLILVIIGLWIGLALAEKQTERHGISKEALNNLTFYSIFAYLLSGRLIYALANLSAFIPSPLSLFSPNPDLFDSASALIIAAVVGCLYTKRHSLPLWNALDALTPIFASLSIGLSLAHLAAGTAFGGLTDLPWGIELWNATRHPTQIYEMLAALIIFGLLWFRKSEAPPGVLFLKFTALTAGARLFLEAFRAESALIVGEFRLAQIVAWVILASVLLTAESMRPADSAV